MTWLRNKLWNWLTRDEDIAYGDNFVTISNKSKGMNQMIGRLCGRVDDLEGAEETAFNDEVLTEIFARSQRQADIVNTTQRLAVDVMENLTKRLDVAEQKAGGAGVAVKSAHGRIDNIMGRMGDLTESFKQMDLDFSDITTSLCVENSRLKDQLDVIGRRIVSHGATLNNMGLSIDKLFYDAAKR